jgi:hypothetical protein
VFSAKKELQLVTFGRWFPPTSLVFLLLLTCSMVNVNAATIRKDVSVPIPKYQVPMSTLEGYAKAKLLRHLSSELIVIEWDGLNFVSTEHRDVLRNRFFSGFNKNFDVYGLTLKRTQETEEAFIFQFEFEKPEKKYVTIDRKTLLNILASLDVAEQRREFTLIMDIALSYPILFSDSYIEDLWTRHLPNASYPALFQKKIKSASAIKFIAKAIPPKAMPTEIIDTMRLFDLAPFNQNVCWHLSNSIKTDLLALKSLITAHCAATGKVMPLSGDVVTPDVTAGHIPSGFLIDDLVRQKRGREVGILSEKFQFHLEKKPALFALLALPKTYDLERQIFSHKDIGVKDYFECKNGAISFKTEFGVHQMTENSIAAFVNFLSQNEFVALHSLLVKRKLQLGLETNRKKINCSIDPTPTLTDNEPQLESKYGNF